jgi:enterochelin esterase-like enzyme
MTLVELRWTDRDRARPAVDVLVRLVALTDNACEDGRLDEYLMHRASGTHWTWAADLPDDLRTTYQLCPVRDSPVRGRSLDEGRWQSIIAQGEPDPGANDELPAGCVFGAVDRPASVLSMPGAPPQPWAHRRGEVPPVVSDRLTLGDGSVMRVQPPRDGDSPSASALVVLFDGASMQTIGVPETIVNLQADAVVGPMTAVYVESIRGSAPRGPSRVQSLTDHSHLAALVHEHLLPRLEREYDLDPRPDRRVVAGHSLGGLAALHLASLDPDVFGAAAVGSAALWWPGNDGHLSGADVVEDASNYPGRTWMEVGTEEGRELIEANQRLREQATTGGRDLTYREVRGGHDLALWRGGIGDGLAHLLGARTPEGTSVRAATGSGPST